MRTSEILYTAADLIERDGWHQGDYTAAGGWKQASPSCVMGAINRAAGRMEIPAACAVMVHLYGAGGGSLIQWNDAPERTESEVIEVLRAAAVIEAAKENAETRVEVSA